MLTDFKKARRIGKELGVSLLAATEVMKQWSEIARPTATELSVALEAIERFANYRPGPKADNFDWWAAAIKASGR